MLVRSLPIRLVANANKAKSAETFKTLYADTYLNTFSS